MEIEVTRGVITSLGVEAILAHPEECCGLLTGRSRIEQVVRARNVHPDPLTGFEIDPQVLIDAQKAARSGGPRIIGYYHSHPGGVARPSATDQARAIGDNRVWAIIGERDVTFWKDMFEGFVPLSLRVIDG